MTTSAIASLGDGNVRFVDHDSGGTGVHVTVDACVSGLEDGLHGFHVHEMGGEGVCDRMGGHYRRHGSEVHRGRNHTGSHAGDFGNVQSVNGCVRTTFDVDNLTVREILGRGVVLHAHRDDLGTKPGDEESKRTGNAGPRVACGVIVPKRT